MSMTVAKFSLNYSGVLNKGASKFLDVSLRDNLLFHSVGLLYFQFFLLIWTTQVFVKTNNEQKLWKVKRLVVLAYIQLAKNVGGAIRVYYH